MGFPGPLRDVLGELFPGEAAEQGLLFWGINSTGQDLEYEPEVS